MTLVLKPKEIYAKRLSEGRLGMLEIAEGWATKPLGELIELLNGAPFDSNLFNRVSKGKPLIRIRDVGKDDTETWFSGDFDQKYLVTSGDVLVGLDGDFRVAEWHGSEALLNQRVCKLVPREDLLDKRFMVYHLAGWLDAIWEETSATTVKHLSSKTIQEIPFPLPPIEEQKRIVEALDDHLSRLDKALAEVETGRTKEKLFKRSLLHALFENLDADVLELGEVSKPKYGKDVPKHLRGDGFTYPVVGSAGVMTYTEVPLVEDPSILVGRKGNVGAVQMFSTPCSPVDTAYYLVCPADVDLEFMFFQLQSIDLKALDSSTTIPSLRRQDLETVPFRKPGIAKQREIAEEIKSKLSSIDSALDQLTAISAAISSLRRSVLHAAFSGTLLKDAR